MSFLKKFFGGEAGEKASAAAPIGEEEYKGFTIRALEMRAGAQFQLAGMVEKVIGGELKVHSFIRADTLSSKNEAATLALAKGRRLVDERGDGLFDRAGG
ncbi:MAG TPA: HlyU family transcriptional regulator [Devosiaceae bacterium]|nr:HlyU family transcriptional regulator [Devosiaceae bacterium]